MRDFYGRETEVVLAAAFDENLEKRGRHDNSVPFGVQAGGNNEYRRRASHGNLSSYSCLESSRANPLLSTPHSSTFSNSSNLVFQIHHPPNYLHMLLIRSRPSHHSHSSTRSFIAQPSTFSTYMSFSKPPKSTPTPKN